MRLKVSILDAVWCLYLRHGGCLLSRLTLPSRVSAEIGRLHAISVLKKLQLIYRPRLSEVCGVLRRAFPSSQPVHDSGVVRTEILSLCFHSA